MSGAEGLMAALIMIALIIVGVVIALCIESAFLLLGARMVGIQGRSFGKAFATVLFGGIAAALVRGLLSMHPALAALAGFAVWLVIMQALFDTTFVKSLAATLLAWVLGVVVIGGAVLLAIIFLGAGTTVASSP
jgi:hypothetical protein